MKRRFARPSQINLLRAASFSLAFAVAFAFPAWGAEVPPAKPTTSKQISGISLVGSQTIVFDHLKAKGEPDALPDSQITGWKNANGTLNITIPHSENYRMQGSAIGNLKIDPHKIFSSSTHAGDIIENHFNYYHWFLAPYTLDGQHIYVLTHTEWYACLLVGDCDQNNNQINSWETTNNSLVSTDGGATWVLNGSDRAHLIAAAGDHWTGTEELKQRVYRKALNHSGLFTPSRLIKEGDYYYSIGFELHRNFKALNTQTGEAPIDKYGYALIRTKDITRPSAWEAWVSGSVFHPIGKGDFNVFLPQMNGSTMNASQVQIVFDVNAQTYIAIFTNWGANGSIYYMTSSSLAAPSWSDAQAIAGTASFVPDPRGPANNPCNTGFGPGNYVSDIDPSSSGMNFEFTSGSAWLFFVVNPAECGGNNLARDIYRVQLSISYQ